MVIDMSYTEIYSVGENYCQKIGEIKNAWRGAMYVWNDISRRFFNLNNFPTFDFDMQRRIWSAHKEHPLNDVEKAVLFSTMDKVTVKAEDAQKLIDVFDAYSKEHPNSSIGEQAEVIKNSAIEPPYKIAWNQTSIGEFQFKPEYTENNEGEEVIIYNGLSESWDLFEQLEAINAQQKTSKKA